MLKLALAKILILALHLAPPESPSALLHVIEGGKFLGSYVAERPEPGHFILKKDREDSKLQPMEVEASPRYKQFYTVYVRENGESASVNLTKALESLKSFSDKLQQDVDGGEGLKLSLARAGSLLLFMAEVEKKPAAGEKPAADAKPAPDKTDKSGDQLLIILEKAFP